VPIFEEIKIEEPIEEKEKTEEVIEVEKNLKVIDFE
jgi:hypothetical protein